MNQFRLRKAEPEELACLISIDDDSSKLYQQAGIEIAFDDDHPFVVAESIRWADAISKGHAYLALDTNEQPIGFTTFCMVDDQPYLDQLSVHSNYMRQGIGTKLLESVISWSGYKALWLTTYSHVPWNRPFYEKHGFKTVPEESCGPELRGILQKQRAALPAPEQRIAMVRDAK